jgi:hypothetical protein
MISVRDSRGRQAACADPVHALYGRNERGQCRECQNKAKQRYESANFIARYLTKRAQYMAATYHGDGGSLPLTMAEYLQRHGGRRM